MRITSKDKQIIKEDIAQLEFMMNFTKDKEKTVEIGKEIQRLKEMLKKGDK